MLELEIVNDDTKIQKVPSSNGVSSGPANPMQQLEQAMVYCGFGRFHLRLLSAALAAAFANNLLTLNTSFLLPSAECDLKMNIMQKGLLNAMPFIGMITSGVFAGFLTDAFGRRRFLIGGYLGVFISCLVEGSSQTYSMLVFGKFLEGVCLTIGFNANMTIVAELTHKDIRDRVMLFFTTFKCIAAIVLVAKSWIVLTQEWEVQIIRGVFELHTWSFYIYLCGLWSLLASIQYYYLPESPKILLAHGKRDEALDVLKLVYCENTGKTADSFPVKSLSAGLTEDGSITKSAKTKILESLADIKYLFRAPLFTKLMVFCFMTLLNMLAYNTFRLWYPQLSTMIESYSTSHNNSDGLCVMIEDYLHGKAVNTNLTSTIAVEECISNPSSAQTYINSMIMGFVCLLCHGISGFFISRISQKTLIFFYLVLCSISSFALHWSYNGIQVMTLVSIVVGFTQATSSLLFTMVVRVFPTTVRSLSVAIVTMIGRFGSTAGNLVFPKILQSHCLMPFYTVAVITLCVAIMACWLPNPSKENRKTGDN